jgi:hypothetical protein
MPHPSAPPESPPASPQRDNEDAMEVEERRGRSLKRLQRSNSSSESPPPTKRMRYDADFLAKKIADLNLHPR